MTLQLYAHPLSSFCHKALIALYENDTPFDSVMVDLGSEASRAAFAEVWPLMKMPALRDEARGRTVAEATIVIEYLDDFYPGATRFIPADPDAAWAVRMWDRFYDNYIHLPMQRLTAEYLRPDDAKDSFGVAQAEAQIRAGYAILAPLMAKSEWAMGDAFTLVDCAAAPALFYANLHAPFGAAEESLRAYLGRLMRRPSYARALREAEPYFNFFPAPRKPSLTPP